MMPNWSYFGFAVVLPLAKFVLAADFNMVKSIDQSTKVVVSKTSKNVNIPNLLTLMKRP